MDFLEALNSRTIVGDGAMGTLLRDRGVPADVCLEELCVSDPDRIQAIHREYIAAGAQFVRTHSFGSNSVRLSRFGYERRVGEFNWIAARTAREAVKGTGAWVAASVGPTGMPSQGILDLVPVFEEQLGGLLDGGADFVILETFTELAELKAALVAKHSLHHCPVVASLAGIDPAVAPQAFAELRAAGADVVGFNCVTDLPTTHAVLERLDLSEPFSVFPNAGMPTGTANLLRYPLDPRRFADDVAAMVDLGVRIVGGCCGTSPEYIAALAERIQPGAEP